MATISNLYIDQGSDYSDIITVASTNGQPLDLTGYTVAAQMRKSYQSRTSYNFSSSIYDAVNGKVRLQLSAESSNTITPGRYVYDVEITSPTGGKTRVIEGIVVITPQVTQI